MSSRTNGIADFPIDGAESCLQWQESVEVNCRVTLPPDIIEKGLSSYLLHTTRKHDITDCMLLLILQSQNIPTE